MISVLNSLPRKDGRYVGAAGQLANTLTAAVERKKKAREDAEVAAESERVRKEAEEEKKQKEKPKPVRRSRQSGRNR
jgi:hypothetical protein